MDHILLLWLLYYHNPYKFICSKLFIELGNGVINAILKVVPLW